MTTPKPEIGKILIEAYQYWMKTLPFQLLFTVIYFSVYMFAGMYAFRYYGLFEEVNKFSGLMYTDFQLFIKKYEVVMQTENAFNFSLAIIVVKSIIYPLNIGFLKIYRKLDLGEQPEISDMFVGFRGHYFFLFVIFSLFWNFTNNFLLIFSIIWMPMLLLVPSLIFFKNYNFLQAFRISVQIFSKNILLMIIAVLLSLLISFSGFIVFFFGIFLTFPFWNAMIYVLYKRLIGDFEE